MSSTPRGDVVFAQRAFGSPDAWLVDPRSGRRIRDLPSGVLGCSWSRDGRVLALFIGQPAGDAPPEVRIVRFLNTAGDPVREDVRLQPSRIGQLAWAGNRLVFSILTPGTRGGEDLLACAATGGACRRIALDREPETWGFAGPTDSGDLYVAMTAVRIPFPRTVDGSIPTVPYALHRLDLDRGRIDPVVITAEEAGMPMAASLRLSPSGGFWIEEPPSHDRVVVEAPERILRDLATGKEFRLGRHSKSFAWMTADRMTWTERTGEAEVSLLTAVPPAPATIVRSWKGMLVGLRASPDRRRLLISVRDAGASPCDPPEEESVWDPDSNRWIELPPWKSSCPFPVRTKLPGG